MVDRRRVSPSRRRGGLTPFGRLVVENPHMTLVTTTAQERLLMEARELQDTTKEICSQLELDDVLVAIVQRANRMLGGDIAFLATCDDSREVLRMRAFDNAHTEVFKTLVFPYGVGLGGAVARERRPISIDTYADEGDTRLLHSTEVDD